MIDAGTTSILLVMAGFILVALIMVHQHHCADTVRRKRGEVEAAERHFTTRIQALEQQIGELSDRITLVDDQLAALKELSAP